MKKKEAPKKVDEHKLAVAEVKRHMSALVEEFQSRVDLVVEQFGGINKKLDEHTKVFVSHSEVIAMIMIQLEEIKAENRQRIDLQQFSRLEKRVVILEAKSRRA